MPKIIVKSTTDGFRRAGIAFGRDGVVLDTGSLTQEQIAAIKAEPKLVVADYVEPAAEGKGKAAK